ncbi:MAG: phage tail protein [Candidatus Nanopelagicales bacterium]
MFPFAGTWVPAGTVRADGATLPISERNAVLYTSMGGRFGGNNGTTFGAPTAKDIPTLPSRDESNPPPIKWLMSTKGTFRSMNCRHPWHLGRWHFWAATARWWSMA